MTQRVPRSISTWGDSRGAWCRTRVWIWIHASADTKGRAPLLTGHSEARSPMPKFNFYKTQIHSQQEAKTCHSFDWSQGPKVSGSLYHISIAKIPLSFVAFGSILLLPQHDSRQHPSHRRWPCYLWEWPSSPAVHPGVSDMASLM